jgi:hypothetical protein
MPTRRIAIIALLFYACASVAQLRSSGALPKNEQVQTAVRDFCRQDFLGARLSSQGWSRIKQLTNWKDNPVWKSFHVISRFEQTSISTGFHSARVGVKYFVLGRFELGAGYSAAAETENVEFKLKDTDDEWRIDDTDPEVLEPHISKQAAVQWLQEKQRTATDPGEKVSIEGALKVLGAAK